MPDIKLLTNNPYEVRNLGDHATNCRSIFNFSNGIELSETEPLYDELLVDVKPNPASVVLDLDLSCGLFLFCHCVTPESLRAIFPAGAQLLPDPSDSEAPEMSP
jgi:hypothetical protein